jgi:hypothetical protein
MDKSIVRYISPCKNTESKSNKPGKRNKKFVNNIMLISCFLTFFRVMMQARGKKLVQCHDPKQAMTFTKSILLWFARRFLSDATKQKKGWKVYDFIPTNFLKSPCR